MPFTILTTEFDLKTVDWICCRYLYHPSDTEGSTGPDRQESTATQIRQCTDRNVGEDLVISLPETR